MKLMKFFLVVSVAMTLLACATAQDKAVNSQAAINNQRLELVDKYQNCMKEAEGDKDREAACDQYLKAADALR